MTVACTPLPTLASLAPALCAEYPGGQRLLLPRTLGTASPAGVALSQCVPSYSFRQEGGTLASTPAKGQLPKFVSRLSPSPNPVTRARDLAPTLPAHLHWAGGLGEGKEVAG